MPRAAGPGGLNTRPPAGKLRYANNSNYKNDVMIRKEVRGRGGGRGPAGRCQSEVLSLRGAACRPTCTRA